MELIGSTEHKAQSSALRAQCPHNPLLGRGAMLCDVRVTWLHRNKTKTKYRRSAVARFSLGRTALNMEDGVVQERGTAE